MCLKSKECLDTVLCLEVDPMDVEKMWVWGVAHLCWDDHSRNSDPMVAVIITSQKSLWFNVGTRSAS